MFAALRPYTLDDAATIWDAARESMADLNPWMPWCHPQYSLDDSRTWLEAQVPAFGQRTAFEFAMVAADGSYLGGCGLNQIDQVNRRANLGYWVRSSAKGRGVATAAVRQLHAWGFDQTDLVRLEVVVAAGNIASQRVAIKAGAAREGLLQRRLLLHGKAHDALMFAFVRSGVDLAPDVAGRDVQET